MIGLHPGRPPSNGLSVLCLGAHSDDLEIGCGGTVLDLLQHRDDVSVQWLVFSGSVERAREARCSAQHLLSGARNSTVDVHAFRDGFFPFIAAEIKDVFEQIKATTSPDLIFTHHGADRHQDHRLISELTWNTFRDHLILEYEIPKYDGGLTTPNLYVPLSEQARERKNGLLMEWFATQRDKRWFSRETFDGLMRLRGIECASPTGYAEGFHLRKATLDLGAPLHGIS
jgi:LmbE family N-acetylglucosaminyl deacetylase